MTPPAPTPDPADAVRAALERYGDSLVRQVAHNLIKPHVQWSSAELIDKVVETQTNAPVLDRRLKQLGEPARLTLALCGVTGRPWRVQSLIEALAMFGRASGATPVTDLLTAGLLYPAGLPPTSGRIDDLLGLLGADGLNRARVFAHPFVGARCRRGDWPLPDLPFDGDAPPGPPPADGLDWPLRLGVLWQQFLADSMRLTQQDIPFKRDLTRLRGDDRFLTGAPDGGPLALLLARSVGLLRRDDQGLTAGDFPEAWDGGADAACLDLWAGLADWEDWDPLAGFSPDREAVSATPTLAAVAFLLLTRLPAGAWASAERIGEWLWRQHPSWGARLGDRADAVTWVANLFRALGGPLRLVDWADVGAARLTPLGRHALLGEPAPPPPSEFPQTLTVQPNAEVIAFRQGLTPALVARLSHFAVWKSLGPACTLELTPEQVYYGLERGYALGDIVQTLNRHGTRPVPGPVAELLRTWSSKRERISVHPAATLMEFNTPEDLQEALGRGVVVEALTDRIGLAPPGAIDYSQLRQVGNRDYESRPEPCLTFDDDGVHFAVDTAKSDLLLETELARLAEPRGTDAAGRRYELTPASLKAARDDGLTLLELEAWAESRGGEPLSAAARLIFSPEVDRPATAERMLVVTFADEATADGVCQWPATAAFVERRLGPVDLAVAEDGYAEFVSAVARLGVDVAERH